MQSIIQMCAEFDMLAVFAAVTSAGMAPVFVMIKERGR